MLILHLFFPLDIQSFNAKGILFLSICYPRVVFLITSLICKEFACAVNLLTIVVSGILSLSSWFTLVTTM